MSTSRSRYRPYNAVPDGDVVRLRGGPPPVGDLIAEFARRYACTTGDRVGADGCLNEGCVAREAELRCESTGLDPEAAALAMIARDEHSHAELAWDIVAWALATDPPAIRTALRSVAMAPPRHGFALPRRCDHAVLRSFGWIDPELCRQTHADVARDLDVLLASAGR